MRAKGGRPNTTPRTSGAWAINPIGALVEDAVAKACKLLMDQRPNRLEGFAKQFRLWGLSGFRVAAFPLLPTGVCRSLAGVELDMAVWLDNQLVWFAPAVGDLSARPACGSHQLGFGHVVGVVGGHGDERISGQSSGISAILQIHTDILYL